LAYAFASFTDDLVAALKHKGLDALPDIADMLRRLLAEPEFAAQAFSGETERKRLLFHDPETDVHVLAHRQSGGKRGSPHSHGASWAVYGNVRGCTHMTEWHKRKEASGAIVLEPGAHYRLGPGETRAYPPHAIHSTEHPEDALVIRITGTDLDAIPRYRFDISKDRMNPRNA
jgi:predicted metal-dependent enzyme (double-stranded beta helix superfamily)